MKKIRRIIAIIILAVLILPLVMSTSVQAVNAYELAVQELRPGGFGYVADHKPVWKIVTVTEDAISVGDKFKNTFYCLDPSRGFGTPSSITPQVTYDHSGDLRIASSIPSNLIPSLTDEKLNQILWLLDNMYDPKSSAEADKTALLMAAGIDETGLSEIDKLTNDDIEVIQQIALWYLIMPYDSESDKNFHYEDLPGVFLGETPPYDQGTIGDDSENREDNARILYKYLTLQTKTEQEKADIQTLYGTDQNNPRGLQNPPISFPSINTTPTTQILGENAYVGPFKITTQGSGAYTLTANITDGEAIPTDISSNVKIYTKSGDTYTEVTGTDLVTKIKNTANQDFYIGIPAASAPNKVKLNMNASYSNTEVTWWTNNNNISGEQPVVQIQKESIPVSSLGEGTIPKFNFELLKIDSQTEAPLSEVSFKIEANVLNGGQIIEDTTTDGKISLQDLRGLGDVLFTITEMTTPEGYEPLTNPITFTVNVSDTGVVKLVTPIVGTLVDSLQLLGGHEAAIDGNTVKLTVKNQPEELIFDLALRKFITGITRGNNDVDIDLSGRVPTPQEAETGSERDIFYAHDKSSVPVIDGDIVTYTIRVYNEGEIDGYVEEITDTIPTGLEFLPDHETNQKYGWTERTLENGEPSVYTKYWSEEACAERAEDTDGLIKARNMSETLPAGLDSRDVEIAFKFKDDTTSELNTEPNNYINIAKITGDKNEEGKPDEDSELPENPNLDYDFDDYDDDDQYNNEDNIDFEPLKPIRFDLALRKFITEVTREENILDIDASSRVPVPKESEQDDRDIFYEHNKTPLTVTYGDIVTYTVRVYNEGNLDGYVEEITDTIPDGLEFLPDHITNQEYGWAERTLEDGRKEVYTAYWSEEAAIEREDDGLIKARDMEKTLPEGLEYRDVQIAFKFIYRITPEERAEVDAGNNKKIINIAEISKDKNEYDIPDKDSFPNNGDGEYDFTDYTDDDQYDNEDDIDFEPLITQYFDLALKKYVSNAIVTVDGKTTEYPTGHTGDENPEPPAKVVIDKKKINSTTVKFAFTITITNEGQIAGYAKEIKDHIPEGLRYVQEDNPLWSQLDERTVVTRALENRLLQPGESASVEIILTWINGSNNLGLKTNVAEISEDYNDTKTPDIDSDPDNLEPNRPYEDDEDDAPVILELRLGAEQVASVVILPTMILSILGVGIYLIKTKVLMA